MRGGKNPDDIGAYIAGQPPKVRAILTKIRAVARKAAPKAVEKISYRMPALFQDGALIYFAAFKSHIGIYPPVRTADAALQKRLAKFAGPKGNLKFPLDEPISYPLIASIVRLRLRENQARAAARKKKTR
jgi:uncharacterized protein YdhG (YjbR/CyaY superfamily)